MNGLSGITLPMAVRLASLQCDDTPRIEAFVRAHPDATPFHRPVWLNAVAQGTGNQPLALLLERGGDVVGYVPLSLIHSPLFGRMLASTGFAVGGGALLAPDTDPALLFAVLEEVCQRHLCPTAELRGGPLPDQREGWLIKTQSHASFIRPLAADDEAELLAIPRKQRAEVRKGLANEFEVATGGAELADEHYRVYATSVRNLGTPVFPRALFRAVLAGFGADADILTIRHQGQAVASVLSLYHGGAVMPYWGGGTWAARGLRANDRMYFELMRHARARGCTHFDFGRSKTASGAHDFKRNWGFDPAPLSYGVYTVPGAARRDADPTSAAHSRRIDLWKKLPLPVANLIGPWIARGLGVSEILFLAHRMPFPPDRGDKIHSHHVLRALAALAPVHVACFADDAGDWAHEGALADLAATYCLRPRRKSMAVAGVQALLTGQPISLTAFHDAALARYVRQTLATGRIGAIFVFSGQMGQYVPPDFTGRVILDLVDVDSAKFAAYADGGHAPMRWVHAREARLLRAAETRYAARADATLLVSAHEAALFASRVPPGAKAQVGVLGNGIDSDIFRPGIASDPGMAATPGPHLIFTGQMDYAPNIAAVTRVVRHLMPAIRARAPEAAFHIVGRAPTAQVRALDGVNGAVVHGAVPDMRPFLAAATLALVPLDIARGIQNKVLEAMAMSLPCVLTSGAANGIAARDGVDFAIADTDAALVEAVLSLCADPAAAHAMGQAARTHILGSASWQAALAPLAALVTPDVR